MKISITKLLVFLFFICCFQQCYFKSSITTPRQINNLFSDLPTIETERLVLRKVCRGDVSDLFAIYSNPEVTKFLHYNPYQSLKHARLRIAEILELYKEGEAAQWAIVLKETKKVIGFGGFNEMSLDHGWGEMGFVLGNDYWQHGYLTELSYHFMKFAFIDVGFNKIKTYVRTDNIPCISFHEKMGFSCEGVARQEEFKNNKYHDLKIFSFLREEFLAKESWYKNVFSKKKEIIAKQLRLDLLS